jgi:nucleoside-diphosphate-sugar epimerase
MSQQLHVVFGGGQVGYPLAQLLQERGHNVRSVRRSDGRAPAGVETMRGDAMDPQFCRESARGATVVYHCMNPPYSTSAWAEQVPRHMDNLIAAAGDAGARLVVLDNLYALGAPRGRKLSEDTPMNPNSAKGSIKARAAEQLFSAHRRGTVVATLARASDFYGPRGTLTTLGDFFWPRALAGKTVYIPYSPDAIHTYHYIPDVALGLATLGEADASEFGKTWMMPCAPAGNLRDIVERLESALSRTFRLALIPPWVLRATALFVPIMKELHEMAYQFDEPFVVDDTRFRTRFGVGPEDPERAATETAVWALEHYGRQATR